MQDPVGATTGWHEFMQDPVGATTGWHEYHAGPGRRHDRLARSSAPGRGLR
jgi:hypothetical protein